MAELSTFVRTSVEDWLAHEAISARRFGEVAVGDPGLVAQLRRGRSLRLRTADRLLAFMGLEPVGPGFRREVEAFLTVTRFKVSVFGEMAVRDPSFVPRLRKGVSPTLATADRVRTWMATHASDRERAALVELLARTLTGPVNKENFR